MLIFDLDGTLWDTLTVTHQAAFNIHLKQDEIKTISIETVRFGMGLTFEENAKNYMPYLTKEKREKYLQEINNETIRLISIGDVKYYDGMIDVIKTLSKSYKLGIVTNNNDDYVKMFLKNTKLEREFVDFIGAGSYNIKKEEAIKRMIKRNRESINYYIGDTKKDMDASIGANVIFIHAAYGFDKNLISKYKIEDIRDLPSYLSKNQIK